MKNTTHYWLVSGANCWANRSIPVHAVMLFMKNDKDIHNTVCLYSQPLSFVFFTSGYIIIDRDLSRWLLKQHFVIYHDLYSMIYIAMLFFDRFVSITIGIYRDVS